MLVGDKLLVGEGVDVKITPTAAGVIVEVEAARIGVDLVDCDKADGVGLPLQPAIANITQLKSRSFILIFHPKTQAKIKIFTSFYLTTLNGVFSVSSQ